MIHARTKIALALAMLAAGCHRTPEAARPSPLKLETKTFERLVPGCGDQSKREQPCVTFRIQWVEVAGAPGAAVPARINAAIRARLQPMDAPPGFPAEADALAEDYERFRAQFPDSGITYFVRRTAEVSFSSARLLCVEIDEDDFRGGAHPNSHREYLNVSPSTGEIVLLAELLTPDGMAGLAALAEEHFRAEKHIESGTALSAAGYNFAGDKFVLSRTWGVNPAGLLFHYNDYEIAPHSTGPTTILLPWSEIGVFIRKESGLAPAG